MMLRIPFTFLLLVISIIREPYDCKIDGVWKVIDVKSTALELGVLKTNNKAYAKYLKIYKGSNFIVKDSVLLFPKNLQKTPSYCRGAKLKGVLFFIRIPDTEETRRYPGDELGCDYKSVDNHCLVGDSFMAMLGSARKDLIIYNYISKSEDKFIYSLCSISDNRMGLLLADSNILLILGRQR